MNGTRLGEMNSRSNSIGFIRLVAATAVIIGHSFPAGGFSEWDITLVWTNNQAGLARTSVDVFFILSGFLIAQSFARTSSVWVFAWHRFLRIYPAFWTVLVVTGFVVAPLSASVIGWEYMTMSAPLITGVKGFIPGVLENAPLAGINDSLWTLPWELRAYVLIGALGALSILRKWPVLALFLGSWAWMTFDIISASGSESFSTINSGVRLFTFFLAGTLFYLLREQIVMKLHVFIMSATVLVTALVAGLFIVDSAGGLFYIVAPVPLAYCTFWLAINLPNWFRQINSSYDYSYGIYIYGTLILNILAAAGLNNNWFLYVGIDLVATLVLAALSWHFIERPALSLKSVRLIREEGALRLRRGTHAPLASLGRQPNSDV
ncbi:acyltransferase [Demequina capsici]|uniref:Acyltransferase n=1 Tax=Demequina capsici TaxID=3075620 RepID=A0AA96J9Z2_9MICO|nr:acyltransferase [Demequina sp. PMTSA13]WNM27807.1 acyltransferase [Demequina sp. PMTSA13]